MNNIKEMRKSKEINQKDLAKAINVSMQTISGYETGYAYPPYDILIKLADYFDCSLDYLTGRETDYVSKRNNLTVSEEQLLYYFRKLDADMQDTVLDVAKIASNSNDKNIIKPQKIR